MKVFKSNCCKAIVLQETGWIEHNGIGHPGGMVFRCSKCKNLLGFKEDQNIIRYYYPNLYLWW